VREVTVTSHTIHDNRVQQNTCNNCVMKYGLGWCIGIIRLSYMTLFSIQRHVPKKVKLSLRFNWAPRHEGVLGEWRCNSTHSLTSALDWDESSASRAGRFTPRERATGTHWIGGWVGPRTVLDAVVKRKIPSPRRESKPRTPIVQPVAESLYRLSYHGSYACIRV
jgi:hypothetical protein